MPYNKWIYSVSLVTAASLVAIGCTRPQTSAEHLTGAANRPASPPEMPPLNRAMFNNRAHEAMELIRAGADPNSRDRDGNTPLFFAAAWGMLFWNAVPM